MRNADRPAGNPALAFAIAILSWGIGGHPPAAADDPRAARFPKVTLQSAGSTGAEAVAGAGADFYEKFIKGKTVIINFFYTKCDGNLCDQGTRNLVQVQKALGDKLGRDVFIYSITLDPEHDTPEVLKAYAEEYGAKPGWSFLSGSAEDIAALRVKLGLSNPNPELSRKLNPVSNKVAEAGKVIEAKAPMAWEPKALRALVGEAVEWKMGAGMPGNHGVRITNWAAVKDHVEVVAVDGQQPFNATTGRNDNATNTAGKVLLRLKIKSDPLAPTKITYDCIVHGSLMKGEVSVGQQHSAMMYIYNDPADRKDTVPILTAPNQVLETIERLKGRQRP